MLQIGAVIRDTYRVEALMGQGMSQVYLVRHTRLPLQLALKIMDIGEADFLQRFRREAEILSTLRHPHIVQVSDWNTTEDGRPYLVMELLEGQDLSRFLASTGRLSIEVVLPICRQIGEALAAAHRIGVVHRDLKPANIFLCKNGPFPNFVKVLDFGVAKQLRKQGGALATRASSIIGTPAYMSPEQARGEVDLTDARSDLFSLATIIYEMLSGQQAFGRPGEDAFAVMRRVTEEQPPPLPLPKLDAVVRRAMSKQRELRYASIEEFLDALGARTAMSSLPQPPVATVEKSGESHPSSAQRERSRWLWAGGGLMAACVVAVCMYAIRHRPTAVAGPIAADGAVRAATVTRTDAPAGPHIAAPPSPAGSPPPGAVATVPPPATGAVATVTPPATGAVADPVPAPSRVRPDLPIYGPSQSEAAQPAVTPVSRPQRGYAYSIAGPDLKPPQVTAIRRCAEQALHGIRGLRGASVRLARSGALQIVEAPSEVNESNLASCLRTSFLTLEQTPRSAIISIH